MCVTLSIYFNLFQAISNLFQAILTLFQSMFNDFSVMQIYAHLFPTHVHSISNKQTRNKCSTPPAKDKKP